MTEIADILTRLEARLSRIEERLEAPFEPRFQREWYTVAEAENACAQQVVPAAVIAAGSVCRKIPGVFAIKDPDRQDDFLR